MKRMQMIVFFALTLTACDMSLLPPTATMTPSATPSATASPTATMTPSPTATPFIPIATGEPWNWGSAGLIEEALNCVPISEERLVNEIVPYLLTKEEIAEGWAYSVKYGCWDLYEWPQRVEGEGSIGYWISGHKILLEEFDAGFYRARRRNVDRGVVILKMVPTP
jgi:hypothetical protein